ncbi:phage tail protein, partial [Streptococcus anginosus]|nr:phage tail protein [Streptococcus anginosus]
SGAPDPATEEVEGEFIMKPVGDTKQIMLIGYESDPDFDLATFRSLVFPKNDSELTAAWAKVKAKLNPSS